ncbi:hypothetical protein [Methylomonas koyamae]|uniref:hypothetical protein n=1 Tax=Methylomonas koyamae TaxID=702114 RepID=UPI0012FE1833|nr:hypothetical protein [Methylomonas koyamae]
MSRGHSIYHFATKNDYALVLSDISSQFDLKYVVDEWRLEPDFRVYASPFEAPDFENFKWAKSHGTRFFVLPINTDLPFRYWESRQVPEKYGFMPSQIEEPPNYRFVFFDPSGFHRSDEWGEGLLQGWLSTNSVHPDSLAIFNAFKKSIKKRFEYFRCSGVYVGPEAVKYFDAGGRLAEDLRLPKERDMKRTAPNTNTTSSVV